nr:sporozoite surface protein 2-like [Labrus bergylta]
MYRRWQSLQKDRERLRGLEERFLARLPPDYFLSDDDQSSRPSDPSLHSDDDQSSRPSDPSLHSDDDQSSRPSYPSLHSDDDQSSRPSDPSLHSDDDQSSRPSDPSFTTRDHAQSSRPSDPSLPTRDQIRQRLQQLREQLRVREERFLARLPPDLDDDQSSRPSDPSLHSDQSKEKMIDLKKIEIDYPAWDQSLLPEREDF